MITHEPIIQIYRDSVRGGRDGLARLLDRIVALGMRNVVFHGFPSELNGAWDRLVPLAHERALAALASWGLDSDASAKMKGRLMGEVLARSTCAAGLLDAEGQWDTSTGPADERSERGAIELGNALREVAPHALVGDQPWPAIDQHGELRRVPKPIDQGGVFAGFPVDEFARVVNWIRFRQAYCNNAPTKRRYGEARAYRVVFDQMDREWAKIAPALRSAGLERPLGVTIQGYRWHLPSLVACLLDQVHVKKQPVIVWSEPFPDDVWITGYLAVQFLAAHGFIVDGRTEHDIVRAYQREWNRTAGWNAKLVEDGLCGLKTIKTMGIKAPD